VRLPARSALPENPTHPALPLPLVARDDDVSWLEDRRQQVRGGLLGARLVGEQGAGKTRLLTELLTRASADGDFVAVTGPDPHHAEVAGYALRTAIETLAGVSEIEITELAFEDASPVAEAGLVELFDPAPKRHDIRSPQERRLALAEGLRWALSRAAKRSKSGRIVLAIDDLQRVDGPSRNAFADVLGEPPRLSALFWRLTLPASTRAGVRKPPRASCPACRHQRCRGCYGPATAVRAPTTPVAVFCPCTWSKCFATAKRAAAIPPPVWPT
jgi:hypothetical protein